MPRVLTRGISCTWIGTDLKVFLGVGHLLQLQDTELFLDFILNHDL